MGAARAEECLPPILRAVTRAGHPVVWACDPMHGNTFVHESGYKTRHFDDVIAEVKIFFEACRAEACGRAACTSSSPATTSPSAWAAREAIRGEDLAGRYETVCDPRLNARQSLDLAFHLAELVRR